MGEPRKAMKVTVLPAGHPLLRGLNPDQQIVVRPGVGSQTGQQVMVRPGTQQQLVLRPQPGGGQQIMFRPQQQNGTQQIVIRPGTQQQMVLRPVSNPGPHLVNGQIRLTQQQLASLTSQQIVIRPQQRTGQHQILLSVPSTSSSTPGSVRQVQQTSMVTTAQTQGKSVITYLRPVRTEQQSVPSSVQAIKLSGGPNIRLSAANTGLNTMILSPAGSSQTGLIRLGSKPSVQTLQAIPHLQTSQHIQASSQAVQANPNQLVTQTHQASPSPSSALKLHATQNQQNTQNLQSTHNLQITQNLQGTLNLQSSQNVQVPQSIQTPLNLPSSQSMQISTSIPASTSRQAFHSLQVSSHLQTPGSLPASISIQAASPSRQAFQTMQSSPSIHTSQKIQAAPQILQTSQFQQVPTHLQTSQQHHPVPISQTSLHIQTSQQLQTPPPSLVTSHHTFTNHSRLAPSPSTPTPSSPGPSYSSPGPTYQLTIPSSAPNVTLHKQKPNIVRSAAKTIVPRTVPHTGSNTPTTDLLSLHSNNFVFKQGSGSGVSLVTQSRGQARVQDGASREGLQLITADGKFINTEGLHLLSPNGTVLKADSLLQNISSATKLNSEKPSTVSHELNAQQLISHLQQPLPYQATSLSLSSPPHTVVSRSLSPRRMSPLPCSLPPLVSPSSSVLLSPPRLLDSSPQKSSPPAILQRPPSETSIQSLLPTQPLLPSQIRGLTSVARPLNFSPRAPPKETSTPKPRAKSKKETMRARVAKLETSLNTASLLALIDRRKHSRLDFCGEETELERDFLLGVEAEARGEMLGRQAVELRENYYKQNKVNRYLQLNITSDSEDSGEDTFDDAHLVNLLKKHLKRKKRNIDSFGLEDQEPGGGRLDLKKITGKSSNRGRPVKGETTVGSSEEQENLRRHRLWISIMKKEITKGGKARNYNSKEKMAGAKRLATACMRVQRQRAMASQRLMKEAVWRAKRLTREMQVHWRKYDREEKQQKKAKEKVVAEQRKMDIELLEAKRQQRKLNFLITQTELYAHFMAGKLGVASEQDTEKKILAKLDSDVKEERLRLMDDYDENIVKERARETATLAAQRQESMRTGFDKKVELESGSLRMSEAAETAGDRPQPDIFQGTLKTYQLKGMNWLCSLYDQGINGILADEMGLGKTVQALAFLSHVAERYGVWGPFLVVTPASTLHNWQQEIAKFVPDFKCVPYWGSPQERKVLRGFWTTSQLHTRQASFHIVVTSYQIVITDYKYFSRHAWQYMVLDEAQAIKSASSQRWKMLLDFNCRGRLLLSGTPIQNTMAELWSLLHFVMPALFDSHDEFKEWFSKDIEGHAEGSKGKVDEKQMSRLHLILKPFMLRRIKKEVENELTDKVEVLLYCPLTIRQRLLYAGLKQNLKMEELLAGLGLGNGVSSLGVSSLMNLVMQFRKVCNHPELFERREPRSALLLSLPSIQLPCLPFLDPPSKHGENPLWNVLRPDRVHFSLQKTVTREYLEVSESPYSFLRFCDLGPSEPEEQRHSLFQTFLYISRRNCQHQAARYNWSQENSARRKVSLLLPPKVSSEGLIFTSMCSTILSHLDVTVSPCPETIQHRQIRSRSLQDSDCEGIVHLVAEFPHTERAVETRPCQPAHCPAFLLHISPRATALPSLPHHSSRQLEYRAQDHSRIMVDSSTSVQSFITHGSLDPDLHPPEHYSCTQLAGLAASRPILGWSGIVIPEKASLISDAGKLFVLDGLLARLKEGGHRVLIYSQMTRMIDLLEEYMSHRQHSYMRLDGSSKIHERRDMVADFQTRQDIFVFLLSTRAGGLGINLTAADTVIFYDSDWNPTVDQQAMDRAHRLGQTRQVTVYRLVCKGTIEERILQRAREKEEIHRMVIQGGSFKGKGGDLRPKEVVSLLLDDEEIEKRVKVKLEEEEEKVEKEKREKTKTKKREGAAVKKEAEKRLKVDEENVMGDSDHGEDPKSLYDFAGDKMGPKKPKGRGGGKRGRPRGSTRGTGRGETVNRTKVDHGKVQENGEETGEETFGFYNLT